LYFHIIYNINNGFFKCGIKKVQEKIGENMNRKIMILMVAVVATVLPAVAVADVMITGSVSVLGTQAPDSFYLSEGPNYAVANETGVFGFIPAPTGDASLGTIDLEGTSNLSVSMINVLEFNFSVHAPGIIYVNLTSSDFPSGSYIAFSTSPMTKELGPTPTPSGSGMSISSSGSRELISVTQNSLSGTYYLGFYLPPGSYSGDTVSISMTYVPS